MKKLLFCGLTVLSVFIIYLSLMDKKVYYLALGNSGSYSLDSYGKKVFGYSYYVNKYLSERDVLERYVYQFSNSDKRAIELINDIRNNRKRLEFTLKNSLIKADLVTLCISVDDVFEKLRDPSLVYSDLYNYIDDLVDDLDILFNLMREYCKEDIIFIGFYNPYKYLHDCDVDDVISYLNRRFKETAFDYKIDYVSLEDFGYKYLPNKKSVNLSSDGYKKISDKVIKIIDKKVLS